MKRFASLSMATLLWEAVSRSVVMSPSLFPPPSAVAVAFFDQPFVFALAHDAMVSMWRLLAGLALAIVTGIAIGLLTGRSGWFDAAASPVINALRPLPPVAIIPLVIVWFGIGDGAKIFSIAFSAFFPVWLSTHAGAAAVADEYAWSARLLTRSRFAIFSRIVFPAALPFIVTGIRAGIATAFVMVFVSELAGANAGIGYRISIMQLAYRVDRMVAALAILAFLAFLCDRLFQVCVARCFPWFSSAR